MMNGIQFQKIEVMIWRPALFLCLFGLLTSCRSNSLSPDREATFGNIQPIFNNTCSGGSCHVGQTTSGVRLDSYQAVINSVGVQYGEAVILAGNAAESPLIDKIEGNPQVGSRMPLGRSPLSESEIELIRSWINNGAQDD